LRLLKVRRRRAAEEVDQTFFLPLGRFSVDEFFQEIVVVVVVNGIRVWCLTWDATLLANRDRTVVVLHHGARRRSLGMAVRTIARIQQPGP
jgi:hypothetical protein